MRIECPVPNHEGQWIERANEISIGFWNRWRAADHDETQKLICEILTDWNLIGTDGNPAPKPVEGLKALEALSTMLLPWLVSGIGDSILADLGLPKEQSRPSSN